MVAGASGSAYVSYRGFYDAPNFQSGQVAPMPKAFMAHFPKAAQPG